MSICTCSETCSITCTTLAVQNRSCSLKLQLLVIVCRVGQDGGTIRHVKTCCQLEQLYSNIVCRCRPWILFFQIPPPSQLCSLFNTEVAHRMMEGLHMYHTVNFMPLLSVICRVQSYLWYCIFTPSVDGTLYNSLWKQNQS